MQLPESTQIKMFKNDISQIAEATRRQVSQSADPMESLSTQIDVSDVFLGVFRVEGRVNWIAIKGQIRLQDTIADYPKSAKRLTLGAVMFNSPDEARAVQSLLSA